MSERDIKPDNGLERRYAVKRLADPEGKHDGCDFFVLDLVHDRFAYNALAAYALACFAEFPQPASDLHSRAQSMIATVEGVRPDLDDCPIHTWFNLTYSNYFTIPRLALQEMPVQWQRRFVALMEEAEALGMKTPGDYTVLRRAPGGRFRADPWADYRRGTVAAARAADEGGRR